MRWKDFPYWLKGGIVGLSLIFILVFIGLILFMTQINCLDARSHCRFVFIGQIGAFILIFVGFIPLLLSFFTNGFSFCNSLLSCIFMYFILYFLITLEFWFIVGALIGLIIGKIKSNKK